MKDAIEHIAVISMHSSPFAQIGMENTGGMNVYLKELTREFCARGMSCDIYTHASIAEQPAVVQFAESGRLINIKTKKGDIRKKNELHHCYNEFTDGILNQGKQYDVVFSHYWLSGIIAMELNKIWGTPFVQMFHTLARVKDDALPGRFESESRIRGICEGRIMDAADRVVVATKIEKRDIMDLYDVSADKISIISPGVDTGRFREAAQGPSAQSRDKVILYVGRIQYLKGIDVLIRAVATIVSAHRETDFKVLIVGGEPTGDDPWMKELKQLCRTLGVERFVHFLGFKNHDELVEYYAMADTLILPSRYESFGMVALEAMACGKPVVVTDACGISAIIENDKDGIVIPADDVQALADKIMKVLNEQVYRQRIGQAARRKASHYGWSSIAGQVLHVFGEVASRNVPIWWS